MFGFSPYIKFDEKPKQDQILRVNLPMSIHQRTGTEIELHRSMEPRFGQSAKNLVSYWLENGEAHHAGAQVSKLALLSLILVDDRLMPEGSLGNRFRWRNSSQYILV
jgi:hypothetical protein